MHSFLEKPNNTMSTKLVRAQAPSRAHIRKDRAVEPSLQLHSTISNKSALHFSKSKQENLTGNSCRNESKFNYNVNNNIPTQSRRENVMQEGVNNSRTFSQSAQPESSGVQNTPHDPFVEVNEDIEASSPAVRSSNGSSLSGNAAKTAKETTTTQRDLPAQAAVTAARTVIRGPREMWNFNGETPPNYLVSSRLSTNRTGGAFQWSTSSQLTLSSASAATPTVTTVTPSVPPGRDAWIRVRHTDGAGVRTAASYRLTILAPDSLNHLRNVDSPAAGLGYESEIHYSILDQFGSVLPRNVPLNEEFTGPAVADFPGGNWTRPPACGATGVCGASFNPADWHDRVTGEGDAGAVPAPVGPAHPNAGVAAEHWPGNWYIGGRNIGSGRRVASVTWQRNRGFARHT